MTQIARLLDANAGYAAARAHLGDPKPGRRLAVVTCMDARIDVFAVLGLHLGEALVIRNAGARVTDDVLRSLTLAIHLLGVDAVLVMQHTQCALAGKTDAELRAVTAADLDFATIHDHAEVVRADVELLSATPHLSSLMVIAGAVYDIDTGKVDEVVRWRRTT
jgi:carbonic anhydrase